MLIVAGAWCYYSWRALIILPALAVLGMLVAAGHQNQVYRLPLFAQRSISFLPGEWDKEVSDSAKSSNEFRDHIKQVYIAEYLSKSPVLGNGFTYDSAEMENWKIMAAVHDTPDAYYFTKAFITAKLFHVGWISVYDAVGFVGTIALCALNINLL